MSAKLTTSNFVSPCLKQNFLALAQIQDSTKSITKSRTSSEKTNISIHHEHPHRRRRTTRYKTRFLGEKGGDRYPIEAADIAYFFSEYKLCFLMTFDGSRYLLEKSLAALEAELDPAQFHRANRQVIVGTRAVRRFSTVSKSKLLLELLPKPPFEVVVSQEQAAGFKEWIGASACPVSRCLFFRVREQGMFGPKNGSPDCRRDDRFWGQT